VSRTAEMAATIGAGIAGAALAVFAVGASLLLVVPAALGVGLVAAIAGRTRD
jgi:hypothetical protein